MFLILLLWSAATPVAAFPFDAQDVPGATVAVIRANRIESVHAYGVTNTITRTPVTPDTPFPVASNGKPIAAWLAVRHLKLDEPVLYGTVTPRHLLTHTSGLGNFLRDRKRALSFAPGARFAYSGVGVMVLQEQLEQRTGKSLDELASSELFVPLGMRRSWFGQRPAGITSIAAPHIPFSRAVAPFSILAGPAVLVLCGIVALIRRRLGWKYFLAAVAVASAGTFSFLLSRSGSWVLATWFSLVPLTLFAIVIAAFAMLRRTWWRAACAAIVIAAFIAVANLPVPLPTAETGPPNAASSLRATAPDLARFLIALSREPEMTRAHHEIDAVAAWGLGIGIERHARGRDLWHWGSNPGAKSLMILCPEPATAWSSSPTAAKAPSRCARLPRR